MCDEVSLPRISFPSHSPVARGRATTSARMRSAPIGLPVVHWFVCANRREAGSALGPGCSESGEVLYERFKAEVARGGEIARVWVTKTFCLGVCPKVGATVARYPTGAL